MDKLAELVADAPVYRDHAKPDWAGIGEALHDHELAADSALAVSWCVYETRNIEALIDGPTLAIMFPSGIVTTLGKRALFSGRIKAELVPFQSLRSFGPVDHEDERGFGKFCIEFYGPGGVLLGRLRWTWKAKRFRDSRTEVMAVADERDRFLECVRALVG